MRLLVRPTLAVASLTTLFACQASFRAGDRSEPLCEDRAGAGGIACPPASTDTDPLRPETGRPDVDAGLGGAATADLYALRARQNEFKRRHGTFARHLNDIELDFEASAGVRVQLLTVAATGWSAVARVRESGRECAIYEGSAPRPRDYVSQQGVVACAR